MKKSNDEVKNLYTTLDAYQAGFLVLQGYYPQLRKQGRKVVFCFEATPSMYDAINDYNSGATVEALRFTMAIKQLKSQIFSMKTEKEKWEIRNDLKPIKGCTPRST